MPECPQLPPADGQPCVSPAGTQARRVSTLIAELCGSLPLVKTKLFPRCANTMEALVERNLFPWWSTAAATGATRTRSLVRRTRSLGPDSGRRPSTLNCALKNLVAAMDLVMSPHQTSHTSTTQTTWRRPRQSKSRVERF